MAKAWRRGWTTPVKGYLSLVNIHDLATGGSALPARFCHHLLLLAWGPGYFGMPHILLRFYARLK
ncbi:MAG: hypothetical protein ACLUJG_10830 [Lawsonibacter sp.]